MSSRNAPASVSAVINTLTHERHARGALISAFAEELRAVIPDEAPESTRSLAAIARAERGEVDDDDFARLLTDLRTITNRAA